MKDWAKKAVDKWGPDLQMDMLMEECGELISAVNKYKRRKPDSFNQLASEIADVEIMIEQVKGMLFYGTDSYVCSSMKKKKIARLRKLLKAAQ